MSAIRFENAKLVLETKPSSISNRSADRTRGVRPLRTFLRMSPMAALTATVLLLFPLGATLQTVAAAQTRDGGPQPSATGDQARQLPPVEMPSSIQAAVDGLGLPQSTGAPMQTPKLGDTGTQSGRPVGMLQTSNCVNPHPGTAQQSQQQIDQCHIQIWLKYNDGCTGYRTATAQSGGGGSGGANCGNTPPSDEITWTYCAAKHTP